MDAQELLKVGVLEFVNQRLVYTLHFVSTPVVRFLPLLFFLFVGGITLVYHSIIIVTGSVYHLTNFTFKRR